MLWLTRVPRVSADALAGTPRLLSEGR
jgi:hypothetical protein